MELIFLVAGFAGGVMAVALCLRRAKKHPDGKTAKFINMLAGGGGGPKEPA